MNSVLPSPSARNTHFFRNQLAGLASSTTILFKKSIITSEILSTLLSRPNLSPYFAQWPLPSPSPATATTRRSLRTCVASYSPTTMVSVYIFPSANATNVPTPRSILLLSQFIYRVLLLPRSLLYKPTYLHLHVNAIHLLYAQLP